MKSENESWDEFMSRLTDAVELIHPGRNEWKDAYKKAFTDHKKVFKDLAKWYSLKIPNYELIIDLHNDSILEFGGETGILIP